MDNFSIVNGCQTTVSIAEGPDIEREEVTILARFITSAHEGVVDSIITYTNSQTPIRQWDVSSQDRIQRRLKQDLAEDPNPFFYELRRGEQRTLPADEKKRFTRDGQLQVIRPDLLAQYLGAYKGLPVAAYKDKASLFTAHREAVFAKDIRAEEVIIAWQAAAVAEEEVHRGIREAVANKDSDEERILKRGGKMFVLAVMAIILIERNGAASMVRLKREVASSNRTRERLTNYATLARNWYVDIVKDFISDGADLNVLLRSQETFGRIRQKILSRWKTQVLSPRWVDDALPKLGA